ncbi:MAG: LacI family DNA-binding transcriptional regulator [Nonomuraea sp.]|nr:LacI family DNA-binding transcriptional regulator [Nonomuraea sp.]
MKEVARHAGVSVGTVSNVLNRPWVVAPKTLHRVRETIRELGFVRNESARHLRAGQSRTVGVVVIDVANPFFTDIAQGAEALADEYDTMVVLCNSANDPDRESRHLDQLEQQRVRGVLVTPIDADNPRLRALADKGTAVVLVDRVSGSGLCSVSVDDRMGGRLAADHLARMGHHRMMFLGGPLTVRQVADRHEGVTAAVKAAGGVALQTMELPTLSVTEGRKAGERVARMPEESRPTAVFCANDVLALGFLQAMAAQGISVPRDMAIVGYDDIEFAAAATVPRSSVRQPRDQLGRAAMELLQEEVGEPDLHAHRQIIFQPELVVRRSSDPAH